MNRRALQIFGQVWTRGALGVLATLLITPASAQYAADAAEDEHSEDVVRYFGSAKDVNGKPLPDVIFRIESEQEAFIFITNTNGRFRGTVPSDIPYATVKALCFKKGLEPIRVVKRPGPKAARQASVQVDCVLRESAPT